MLTHPIPGPHLKTAYTGPLHYLEQVLLKQVPAIEHWFRLQWRETPPPMTSSVDLRYAGYKLAPVDTNLFPAGFNNLNPEFLPLCIQAVQSVMNQRYPWCKSVLLLPENHTRNTFYLQSLGRLYDIFTKAGFVVRVGGVDDTVQETREYSLDNGSVLRIEPVIRAGSRIRLHDFDPCMLLLNNDLSTGIPAILRGIEQVIQPPLALGWSSRLKSAHFNQYSVVAKEFSEVVGLDPWVFNPIFKAVEGVDFMSKDGLDIVASIVAQLLNDVREQYTRYNINEEPFVVVKADNGTYGMSVMMVRSADEVLQLNRKQRTKMSASKGSQKVTKVIVQEGVYSMETMPDGSVAEPVVYMIGEYVIGGFYRVHSGRGRDENLNAPGMHFEPLAFAKPCNLPQHASMDSQELNRFYTYGVTARLAALAAAREMAAWA